MAVTLNVFKRVLRPTAFLVMRYLLPRINPASVGSWTESIVRRLGFSQLPRQQISSRTICVVLCYLAGITLMVHGSTGMGFQPGMLW